MTEKKEDTLLRKALARVRSIRNAVLYKEGRCRDFGLKTNGPGVISNPSNADKKIHVPKKDV